MIFTLIAQLILSATFALSAPSPGPAHAPGAPVHGARPADTPVAHP